MALPLFRSLWIAVVISNIGTWLQDVGQGWLMTSLTPSPLLVALISTSVQAPAVILALPAGVLADLADRRWLLLATQTFMALCAATLAVLTVAHLVTPPVLLACTLAMGVGAAIYGPAWQAAIPDVVPRPLLPRAVVWNGVAWNVARAIGPVLGGLLVARLGPAAAFAMNAVSFLATIVVIWRWPAPVRHHAGPPERFFPAIVAGLRFARHSAELRAVLGRSGLFSFFGASSLALLPVLSRRVLGGGPLTYGALLGAIGVGAIVGAALRSRLRRWVRGPVLLPVGMTLCAAALGLLSRVAGWPLAGFALFLFGLGWILVLSSVNTAAQLALPVWVRARGLGIYLLINSGGWALGSAAAGHIAGELGLLVAFTVSAAGLLLGAGMSALAPLPDEGFAKDLSTHAWSEAPRIEGYARGPVIVMVRYPVDAGADMAEARRAVRAMASTRLRDGATGWRLYEDADEPGVLVEVFTVSSWEEHLRQHARGTVADRLAFNRAKAACGGGDPEVIHLVAAP